MENNDLTNALMKVHGVQNFQDGGAAQTISPDLLSRINRFAGDPGIYTTLPEMSEQERQERFTAREANESVIRRRLAEAGLVGSGLAGGAGAGMAKGLKGLGALGETVDPAQELKERANRMGLESAMDMVGPTRGAISNREMELFQQASPSSGQISDQERAY